MKCHWCILEALDWWFENVVENIHGCVLIHIVKNFFYVQVFRTINYFPTYGNNSSGYSANGHFVYAICEENMKYTQLKHKFMYNRHWKVLYYCHPYYRMRKTFNGRKHDKVELRLHSGEELYDQVKSTNIHHKMIIDKNIWKKLSISYNLLYSCKLDVRHCINTCGFDFFEIDVPIEVYIKILKIYVKN